MPHRVMTAVQLVQRVMAAAPAILDLYESAQAARAGDDAARKALLDRAPSQIAEIVSPGLGPVVDNVRSEATHTFDRIKQHLGGNVIEAEYRDVSLPTPWKAFAEWFYALDWGTSVILGPKGQGKTYMAMHLAARFQAATGYRILAVNVYPDDIPERIRGITTPMSLATFVDITNYIRKTLGLDFTVDNSDQAKDLDDIEAFMQSEGALDGLKGAIVVLDEAGLAIPRQGGGSIREAALTVMQQARHLEWIVIYIGQNSRQIPQELFSNEVLFLKRPLGNEPHMDRENPWIREAWREAITAFGQLPETPWFDALPDPRGWAYAVCPSLNTMDDIGYRGLVPFQVAAHE